MRQLKKLTERVYYMPADGDLDRPVLGYIKGDKFSLRIDAGNSASHVANFDQEVERLGLPKEAMTLITHWHWDHTYGIHAVDTPVLANKKTNAQLGVMAEWKWTEEAMQERLETGEECAFCDQYLRVEYDNPVSQIKVKQADLEFEGELNIDLGNLEVKVFPVVNPHSEDGMVIYIPSEKVAFIGDTITEDFYNNSYLDPEKMAVLRQTLSQLDADFYLHGHIDPISFEELDAFMQV